jgi:hypothetical protein
MGLKDRRWIFKKLKFIFAITWVKISSLPLAQKIQSAIPAMEQHALKNVKKLFEYKHLLLLRDIWWSKFYSIFKCCSFFWTPELIKNLWQLKAAVFLHWYLIRAVPLTKEKENRRLLSLIFNKVCQFWVTLVEVKLNLFTIVCHLQ